jgi:hypothetical protein
MFYTQKKTTAVMTYAAVQSFTCFIPKKTTEVMTNAAVQSFTYCTSFL